jgi:hypothetical protein
MLLQKIYVSIYRLAINHILMSVEFEVTLVKWGNSLGFILPKPIRDGMKLKAGGKIRIVVENNRIFIEKAKE